MKMEQQIVKPLREKIRSIFKFKKLVAITTLIFYFNALFYPHLAVANETQSIGNSNESVESSKSQPFVKLQKLTKKKLEHLKNRVATESGLFDEVLTFFGISQIEVDNFGELRQANSQLQELHTQKLSEFKDIENRLIKSEASEKILQRHRDAVKTYNENYQALQAKLQAVFEAEDIIHQEGSANELNEFLESQKFERKTVPVDPDNMPWGSPDAEKTRKPVVNHDKLSHVTGIPNHPQTTLLASNSIDSAVIGQLGGPVAEDLVATPDVKLTDAIKLKAQQLDNDPIKIYNWVRNNIEYIPTYGSIQGAHRTLQHGKGNAFDTSSLLISLLRAADIPARYAYGTVDIPSDKAMNWVGGVNKAEAAQQLFGQGGIPNTGIIRNGAISEIRIEHIWVEAWIDYFPSRGAKHRVGDQWIPMDPSFKQYDYLEPTLDLTNLSFEGRDVVENFLSLPITDNSVSSLDVDNALDNYAAVFEDYRDEFYPTDELQDMFGRKKQIVQDFQQFPASLPYVIVERTNSFSIIPSDLRHKLKYELNGNDGSQIIVFEKSLPEIGDATLSVSFKPETSEDAEVLKSFFPDSESPNLSDFPDDLPGYLIKVKASFNESGISSISNGSFSIGEEIKHSVSLFDPTRGWQSRSVTGVAGEHRAIGIDLQGKTDADVEAIQAEIELYKDAIDRGEVVNGFDITEHLTQLNIALYFALNDVMNQFQSNQFNVVEYRMPSFGFFHTSLSPSYYFGVPQAVSFPGVTMDVPFLQSISYSKSNLKNEWLDYKRTQGPRASLLESWVPEQIFGIEEESNKGVSTTQLLDIAMSEGQNIYVITQSNISDLDKVTLNPKTREDLINLINNGKEITVHESPISKKNWTGTGYIAFDPLNGSGAYIITGGANGGFLGLDKAAWLSLGSEILNNLPWGVGFVKQLIEAALGFDLLTGEAIDSSVATENALYSLLGPLAKVVKGAIKAAKTGNKSRVDPNRYGPAGEKAV